MRSLKTILIFISLLVIGCAHKINPVILKEAPKPDSGVFSAALSAMNEYRDGLQWKDQCSLEINDNTGIIETNWHPVHKGEVKRKIQIYVWGTIYRVDVWHKGSFVPSYGKKDYMARLVEMDLQLSIDNKL